MKLLVQLFGIDRAIPSQIIRKGNQFVRNKTIVTPAGNLLAKLQKDTITILGTDGKQRVMTMHSKDEKITPERAAKFLYENLERLIDPKYDATPAIKEAFRLEKSL